MAKRAGGPVRTASVQILYAVAQKSGGGRPMAGPWPVDEMCHISQQRVSQNPTLAAPRPRDSAHLRAARRLLSFPPMSLLPRPEVPLEEQHVFRSVTRALAAGDVTLSFLARVVGISRPEFWGGRPAQRVQLRDIVDGRSIESLPIHDPDRVEEAESFLKSGSFVVVRGRFLPPSGPSDRPGPDGAPALMRVESFAPLTQQLSLLGATPEERAEADALLDRLAEDPEALYQYLYEEAFAILDIRPYFNDRFNDCIRLMFLQAVSSGMVHYRTNPRLSVALFSAPGKGKKILTLLAELLAPLSALVQPGLVTPAGLSARTEQSPGGGWRCQPGALPNANRGVCTVDDVHRLPGAHLNAFQAILMSAAEDGVVAPTKAAAAVYESACGLLLNGNRRSDIEGTPVPSGLTARLKDMGFTLELLSRLDTVVEVDCGDDPAYGTRHMAMNRYAPRTPRSDRERAARERKLKLLVARLGDRLPDVDTDPVREPLGDLMDQLILVLRDVCAPRNSRGQSLDTDGLLRRMANGVRKFVGASARLSGRAEASAADVEVAWRMLSFKIETLRYLCGDEERVRPLKPRAEQVERAERGGEARWLELMHRFGGGPPATLAELAQALGCGTKLLRREIAARGYAAENGRYRIPTYEEYERHLQEQEQAEAEAEEGPGPRAEEPPPPMDLEVAPEPELPPPPPRSYRPRDGLPAVPAEYGGVFELLCEMDEMRQGPYKAARDLCRVAYKDLGPLQVWCLRGLKDYLPEDYEMEPGVEETLHAWASWAAQGPWPERARKVLATYAESQLPDMSHYLLREAERGAGLGAGMQPLVEAVLDRLDYFAGRGTSTKEELRRRLLQRAAAVPVETAVAAAPAPDTG